MVAVGTGPLEAIVFINSHHQHRYVYPWPPRTSLGGSLEKSEQGPMLPLRCFPAPRAGGRAFLEHGVGGTGLGRCPCQVATTLAEALVP